MYVGFANTNQLGVHSWNLAGKLSFVRTVSNAGMALCWIRVSRNGHYLYAANTGDDSMSVYDLSDPAKPVEIQRIALGGVGGAEEFSLDPDGNFLYALEQENSAAALGKSNKIYALRIDQETGRLALLENLTTTLPVPSHTRPFGVAIR